MNEELENLYYNIQRIDPSILGDTDLDTFVGSVSDRRSLKAFLDGAAESFPHILEGYSPRSSASKAFAAEDMMDPYNWIHSVDPEEDANQRDMARSLSPRPVKKTSTDEILNGAFPMPVSVIQDKKRIIADLTTKQLEMEFAQQPVSQNPLPMVGTVMPTAAPVRQLTTKEKQNIEEEAGRIALNEWLDETETPLSDLSEQDVSRAIRSPEMREQMDKAELIKVSTRNLEASHDGIDRYITKLNREGTSNQVIIEADEIEGVSPEHLLSMKEYLTLSNRIKAKEDITQLSLLADVAEDRLKTLPEQFYQAIDIVSQAQEMKAAGQLDDEMKAQENQALDYLSMNEGFVNIYEDAIAAQNTALTKMEGLVAKYPDVALTDALNKRIQESKNKAFDNKSVLGMNLLGLLAPIPGLKLAETGELYAGMAEGFVEAIPRLIGGVHSSVGAGMAALGDEQAQARLVRRSEDLLKYGTFRDASKQTRAIREKLATVSYDGQNYDISFDGNGTPIELYDQNGHVANLDLEIREHIMNHAATEGVQLTARDRYNKSAIFNTIGDTSSDLLGTVVLTAATSGLGAGAFASRAREMGSVMLQYSGNFAEEGLREGMTFEEAASYGLLRGGLEGASEMMFPMISRVTDGVTPGLINSFKRIAAEGDKKALNAFVRKEALKSIGGVGTEGFEEVAVELASPVLNTAFNNYTGTDLDTEMPEVRDLIDTYAMGSIISVLPNMVGGLKTTNQVRSHEFLKQSVFSAVSDIEKTKKAVNVLNLKGAEDLLLILERTNNAVKAELADKTISEEAKVELVAAQFDYLKAQDNRTKSTGTALEAETEKKAETQEKKLETVRAKVAKGEEVENTAEPLREVRTETVANNATVPKRETPNDTPSGINTAETTQTIPDQVQNEGVNPPGEVEAPQAPIRDERKEIEDAKAEALATEEITSVIGNYESGEIDEAKLLESVQNFSSLSPEIGQAVGALEKAIKQGNQQEIGKAGNEVNKQLRTRAINNTIDEISRNQGERLREESSQQSSRAFENNALPLIRNMGDQLQAISESLGGLILEESRAAGFRLLQNIAKQTGTNFGDLASNPSLTPVEDADGKQVIGNESFIYEKTDDPNTIVKGFNPWGYPAGLEQAVQAIYIHNELFPDTPVRLVGMGTVPENVQTKEKEATPVFVVEQAKVYPDENSVVTQDEITEDMAARGFEVEDLQLRSYRHIDSGIVVEDVDPHNVIRGTDGELKYIDVHIEVPMGTQYDIMPEAPQETQTISGQQTEPAAETQTENTDVPPEIQGELPAENIPNVLDTGEGVPPEVGNEYSPPIPEDEIPVILPSTGSPFSIVDNFAGTKVERSPKEVLRDRFRAWEEVRRTDEIDIQVAKDTIERRTGQALNEEAFIYSTVDLTASHESMKGLVWETQQTLGEEAFGFFAEMITENQLPPTASAALVMALQHDPLSRTPDKQPAVNAMYAALSAKASLVLNLFRSMTSDPDLPPHHKDIALAGLPIDTIKKVQGANAAVAEADSETSVSDEIYTMIEDQTTAEEANADLNAMLAESKTEESTELTNEAKAIAKARALVLTQMMETELGQNFMASLIKDIKETMKKC